VKSFGANILCSVCQAQPYPDPGSGFRETFSLTRVSDVWFCEQHLPPKHLKHRPKKAQGDPKGEESSS
jgi:hypothetical protein